ncbi:hypothetical protein B0I37DRAFT_442729 [Chaetomium sp. MPI-CAGE-AT-0009]|nr:hypothetical protein B0I37DRAFT_442729 [Chaetomium sp. MPI-CAGE-AT-0009]
MAATMNTPKLIPVKADGSSTSKTPSLQRPEEKHCANCLTPHRPETLLMACHQCRGILYCSEHCARECLFRHRKICYKFKTTKEPADDANQVRAFIFVAGKQRPDVIFIDPNQWEASVEELVCAVSVQPPESPVVMFTIHTNPITGRRLPFDLKIIFRACIAPLNMAIITCYNDSWEQPCPRFPWTGSIAAVRVNPDTGVAESVTTADFKDVLDFFVWYTHRFTAEMYPYADKFDMPAAAAPIRGVLIRCAAMESLRPDDGAFVSVMVDHLHPIRGLHIPSEVKVGDISPLSERVKHPLRVYRIPNPPLETNKSRWECLPGDKSNGRASELMLNAPNHQGHLSHAEIGEAFPKIDGDVLVVREDGQDLDIADVVAMCLEARDWAATTSRGQRGSINRSTYQDTLGFAAFSKDAVDPLCNPSLVTVNDDTAPAPIVDDPAEGDVPKAPIQIMAPDQTIPSLWTKVKVGGVVTFEGFSFSPDAAPVSEELPERKDNETDVDAAEPHWADTIGEQPTCPEQPAFSEQPGYYAQASFFDQALYSEQPVSTEEPEYSEQPEYPEPPPQTYNYSAEPIAQKDLVFRPR